MRHSVAHTNGKTASRVQRVAALVLAVVVGVTTLSFVDVTAASADTPTATVMARTQRMADASLTSGQNGWYEKGASLGLDCYKRGQAVKGYFSSSFPGGWDDLWYRTTDGSFVADIDIETRSTAPITGPCPVPFDATGAVRVNGNLLVGLTATAFTGTWSPAPNFAFQWNLDGQPVAGATSENWQLPVSALGKGLTVTVTGSLEGRTTVATTSSPPTVVAPGPMISGQPLVSGRPVVGQTLVAAPGQWQPTGIDFSYAWLRDGATIADATSTTYKLTAADAGTKVSVRVIGTKTGYSSTGNVSAGTLVLRALTSTPTPTVSGTVRVGSVLTATSGTWAPSPVTLGYSWMRNGVAIAGATAATYTLVAADAGASLTVGVSGSKAGYATVATTSAALVAEKVLTPVPVPRVTGTPTIGQTLTAIPGVWGPAPVTLAYQWLRNGQAIAGATSAQYRLVTADASKQITVRVTGSRSGYTTVQKTSAGVTAGLALTATPAPTVSGTPRVGQTLTAKAGTWGPAPVTLTYQWLRGGSVISGATASSYKLVADDAGVSLTVRVTGTRAGYTAAQKTSAGLSIEQLLTSVTPTITGSPTVGLTLTVIIGSWGPPPVAYGLQWFRNGSAIPGATAKTYMAVAADAGATITVSVRGSKAGYTPALSTSSGVVVKKALTSTPKPVVSGVSRVGETLTASAGSWAPAPVTLKYQWFRSGAAIAGATSSTYTVVAEDALASMSVRVTGSKTGYTSASITSPGVLIEPTTLTSSVPTISGSGSARSTLTANAGTWGPAPVDLAYQWYVAGGAVGGATATTFFVPTWAAGKAVTVTVTGSKAGYVAVSQSSGSLGVALGIGDRLTRGESMVVDSYLSSADGRYRFTLQGDGNLVISGPAGPIWGSRSDGNAVNPLGFQDDGNVVLYRTDGRAVWSTFTDGKPSRELVMQSDGNLVLYGDGGYFWTSNTAQGGGGGGGGARFKLPFPAGASYRINQGPAEHAAGAYPEYNRNAVDFGMGSGSTVVASAGGTVYSEGYDSTGSITILIDHGDNLCTQYAHLSKTVINKGQQVSQGQYIGNSGQTGISTGPHLHWNIVYCNTRLSRETPNTVENGTTYRVGTMATSQNG